MKANLRPDGALIEPRNVSQALSRLQQLEVELARIEKQLADPERRFQSLVGQYEEWRRTALSARERFQREQLLLKLWLVQRQLAEAKKLLGVALDVFKSFEADEWDQAEAGLIKSIEQHLQEG